MGGDQAVQFGNGGGGRPRFAQRKGLVQVNRAGVLVGGGVQQPVEGGNGGGVLPGVVIGQSAIILAHRLPGIHQRDEGVVGIAGLRVGFHRVTEAGKRLAGAAQPGERLPGEHVHARAGEIIGGGGKNGVVLG